MDLITDPQDILGREARERLPCCADPQLEVLLSVRAFVIVLPKAQYGFALNLDNIIWEASEVVTCQHCGAEFTMEEVVGWGET